MSKTNHYTVLGIDSTVSADQIQQAYHRKAIELHPDRHSTSSEDVQKASTKAMSEVNEAFRVLSDPLRRKAYDIALERSKARQAAKANRSVDFGSGPAIVLYLLAIVVAFPVVRAISEAGGRVQVIWAGATLAIIAAIASIWFVIRDMGR